MRAMRSRWFLILVAVLGACGPRRATVGGAPAVHGVSQLRRALDRVFGDPGGPGGQWGIEIVSLDRGDVLYARNPTKLYLPASNQKILTAAAALVRLGPEHRIETRIATDGAVSDGVLHGNLVVVGGGDPGADARFHDGDPLRQFREWAATLRQLGIRRIDGDVIGDDRAFEGPALGQGWAWDDLAFGYAARVTALAFNENVATLEVTPDGVRVLPFADAVALDVRVSRAEAGTAPRIELEPAAGGAPIRVRAALPAGATAPVRRSVAVEDPALYHARALLQVLAAEGLDVRGSSARSARASGYERAAESLSVLWTHRSPPLGTILEPLLKVSQNLYAELIARVLGGGSFAAGARAVEEALAAIGIEPGSYRYTDASGLSRENLVSADVLVRILGFMARHPTFPSFHDALPVAGVDGTLASRLKGTPAEGNARAKTGSMRGVRALSGYVRTAGGERVAFAMLANNFPGAAEPLEKAQDAAVALVAGCSR